MDLVSGLDFDEMFRTFEHSAFRLEVRERYGVYYEDDPVSQFLRSEPMDLRYMESWLGIMMIQTMQGKRIERVRVVSRPYSDYTRYGLWLSEYNVRAGEDIRYLDRKDADALPDHDFWLFDNSRLYMVRFDESDDLLGFELIDDPAIVVQHCHWREVAWRHAVRRAEFLKANGGYERPTGP